MSNNKNPLKPFVLNSLKYDLPSGLVVFVIALPLCLGIALASEAPLFAGLIGGLIGGLVVSLLSGSNYSISGPAAGLTTIVVSSINLLGNFEAFLVSVVLAGVLQICFGYFKAGAIASFFPSTVIKGMLAAIGIILILKQIPHAIGYDVNHLGDFSFFQWDHKNTFSEILFASKRTTSGALFLSLLSLIILIIWEIPFFKKLKRIPSPLVVVVLGILVNFLYSKYYPALVLDDYHRVQIPIMNGWMGIAHNFKFPDFTQLTNIDVYVVALTLAVVASLESLLSMDAIDKLSPDRIRTSPNRELKAQGLGNILSGLLGGLPIIAEIVRGSANINAGARTKAASFFHGAFILVSVLTIPYIINLIPLASLAAILIILGYRLTRLSLFTSLYKQGWEQFTPFVVTILAIVFTDLLKGISIGMAVAAFFILKRNVKNPYFFHKEEYDQGQKIKVALSEEVSFLNKASIIKILSDIPRNSEAIIDASKSHYIDVDVMEVINEFTEQARNKNIQVEFIGFKQEYLPISNVKISNAQQEYKQLFINNKAYVEEKIMNNPNYFEKLAEGQAPKYLLIGCSDSRMTLNEITGTDAGEMFIHRNIANLVVHTDMNLMSVVQYSVEVLKVEHVIVCGHYGCGGVKAAIDGHDHGLIDKWLHNIRDVYRLHKKELNAIEDNEERHKKLVELSVREQVYHLCSTGIIQRAWKERNAPMVHGWVYDIKTGSLIDLDIDIRKDFIDYNIYEYSGRT